MTLALYAPAFPEVGVIGYVIVGLFTVALYWFAVREEIAAELRAFNLREKWRALLLALAVALMLVLAAKPADAFPIHYPPCSEVPDWLEWWIPCTEDTQE